MTSTPDENNYLPPEWRVPRKAEGLVDFSGDGFPIGQQETLLEIELNQGPAGLDVLIDFFKLAVLSDTHVLVFEPTRSDLRAAIVRAGAKYIDAGRYLNGAPDFEAARCALKTDVSLTLFNHDDPVPEDWPTPVLLDQRGRPFVRHTTESDWSLYALGTRDGLPETRQTWVVAKREDSAGTTSSDLLDETFNTRASLRLAHQDARLRMMVFEALNLGFEAHAQAGFLWLGVPGFSAKHLLESCAKEDIAVLGCDHHPYRQRVRIGLTNDEHNDLLFQGLGAVAKKLGIIS
jgi:hypothetical protein